MNLNEFPQIAEDARERIRLGVPENEQHQLASDLMACGLTDQQIEALFADPVHGISRSFASREALRKEIKRWRRCSLPAILKHSNWVETAAEFCRRVRPTLLHWNGDFLDYSSGAYHDLEDLAVHAGVLNFLTNAKVKVRVKDGDDFKFVHEPYDPELKHCNSLMHALRCGTFAALNEMAPPCWLRDIGGPPAAEIISLQNGLLHVPSRSISGSSPSFFTRNALDFEYESQAACPLWMKTLDQYWPPNSDGTPAGEVLLLQEIMGYLLLPDTSMQKIFVMHGPGRSGKGTISRIIAMLLGESNVASSSLQSLALEPFGRQPLIAKTACIISEAAFGPKVDRVAVTGHLKAISGEDRVEVNRKNKMAWIGKLLTRFILLVNKVPNFADDSSAFSARLVVLRMRNSFVGKEDIRLTDKLQGELPGILNWALLGYDRLKANGRFTETESSVEAKENFQRAASPIASFIEERCVLVEKAFIAEADIYTAYKQWCDGSGSRPEIKSDLIEGVVAAAPEAKHHRVAAKENPQRPRGLMGIKLTDAAAASVPKYDSPDQDLIPF